MISYKSQPRFPAILFGRRRKAVVHMALLPNSPITFMPLALHGARCPCLNARGIPNQVPAVLLAGRPRLTQRQATGRPIKQG